MVDKVEEFLKSLPEEKQRVILENQKIASLESKLREQQIILDSLLEMKEAMLSSSEEVSTLKKQLVEKDRAIRSLKTAGVDSAQFPSMEEIETYLNMNEGEGTRLLEKDPKEFLKHSFRHYDILMKQYTAMFDAKELTLDGKSIADKMNNTVKYFAGAPTLSHLANKKPEEYQTKVRELGDNWESFIRWQEDQSGAVNVAEAFAGAALWYTFAVSGSDEFAVDVKEDIEIQKRTKALTTTPLEESSKVEIAEIKEQQKNILDILKSMGGRVQEGLDKTYGVTEEPVGLPQPQPFEEIEVSPPEPEEPAEEEPKKPKKGFRRGVPTF